MRQLPSKFWNKYFLVYDNLNSLIPYQELLRSIIEAVQADSGSSVLDAGSGTGNLAVLLERRGLSVTSIDSSAEGIAIHRQKQPGALIVQSDLTKKLPFPNDSFDRICTNNTIYTISREIRGAVFREFFRVLKPGGIIVSSNLHSGFSPIKIYLDHIRKSAQSIGVVRTMMNISSLVIPTIRIFYYNLLLKRTNKGSGEFMNPGEQRLLMSECGFVEVSEDAYVYSGQAILNTARKIK